MKKRMTSVLVALLLFVLLPVSVLATSATPKQTIRVGYLPDTGMLDAAVMASGTGQAGYGYEYLEKLLEYTTGQYRLEFVPCTAETVYTKLENGEIDLFGLTEYQQEVADAGFVYTQNDLGNNILFLTSIVADSVDTKSFAKLQNSTIGTIASGEWMQSFLDEYAIDATIVELTDTNYLTAYQTKGLDFCVASSLAYPDSNKIHTLAQIDALPMRLVATSKQQALLDDFDKAIQTVEAKEYQYQKNLYQKYFDHNIQFNAYISPSEFATLQQQDIYYVGVQNLHSPFSNQQMDGTQVGVAIDFLNLLEEYADIQIEIVEITAATTAKTLDQLDFYIFPTERVEIVATSTSYLEIPLLVVDHSATIDTVSSIGVLSYYYIDDMLQEGKMLGRNVTMYDSLEDLRKGFNAGAVDSMLVTTASLNYIRDEISDKNFLSSNLDSSMYLQVSYPTSFPSEKIEIIDKMILNLDTTDLSYSLLRNASVVTQTDLIVLLKENPTVILAVIAAVLLLIGVVDERRRCAISRRINFDALTGLYSQHRFTLEVEKRRANYRKREYRLISIDIDNFKYINEIYGYTAGTQILKKLSKVISDSLAKESLCTRAYADNFLIFARKTDVSKNLEDYLGKTERFSEEMSRDLGTEYKFSFSVGIYDIPHCKVPLSYAIDCANVARELGKQTTGTTFHVFSEEINLERAKNNEIAANMEQALATGEFFLFYQPKIDLITEKLVGAEALVRWRRNGKLVAPFHFIPLFEKNGFIQKLDFEVVAQACRFIKQNESLNIPKISVNLSGVTIAKTDVVATMQTILQEYGVHPYQLDIEITESAFVGNDVAQETVINLENMGFSISMDDFGAGISSLNRLKNLEIDTLKIDREFIVDYLGNEKGTTILKSMIGMAKALGIETVAEGIETKEQLETLRLYGCDVGQGYYYSRPVEEAEFVKRFIKKHNVEGS